MTLKGGHLICDTPGCGAVTPADSPRAARWDYFTGLAGFGGHLCEDCIRRRDLAAEDA